ncbi:MAG: hypothetical protein ACFB21_05005 [Opitutales bacterium]
MMKTKQSTSSKKSPLAFVSWLIVALLGIAAFVALARLELPEAFASLVAAAEPAGGALLIGGAVFAIGIVGLFCCSRGFPAVMTTVVLMLGGVGYGYYETTIAPAETRTVPAVVQDQSPQPAQAPAPTTQSEGGSSAQPAAAEREAPSRVASGTGNADSFVPPANAGLFPETNRQNEVEEPRSTTGAAPQTTRPQTDDAEASGERRSFFGMSVGRRKEPDPPEFRRFTSVEGQVIEARLLETDGRIVKLVRDDGQVFETSIGLYSPEDQQYILRYVPQER